MERTILVPVDADTLREAVELRLKELTPLVIEASKKFAEPSDVYTFDENGKTVDYYGAYLETIPYSGICYISVEVATELRLYYPKTARKSLL